LFCSLHRCLQLRRHDDGSGIRKSIRQLINSAVD